MTSRENCSKCGKRIDVTNTQSATNYKHNWYCSDCYRKRNRKEWIRGIFFAIYGIGLLIFMVVMIAGWWS